MRQHGSARRGSALLSARFVAFCAVLVAAATSFAQPLPGLPAWSEHLRPIPPRVLTESTEVVSDASTTTEGTVRVMALLQHILSSMTFSKYRHATRVNDQTGRFEFDCSGMVDWVLSRAAPRAFAATGHGHTDRPLAADFAQVITRSASPRHGRETAAWMSVPRLADAHAGDVIAWKRPSWFPDSNTGHVAFVVEAPKPVPGLPGYFTVRIADSNPSGHENDTRAPGTGGFGMGVWMLSTDTVTGECDGLAMGGTQAQWIFPARIVVGRPLR